MKLKPMEQLADDIRRSDPLSPTGTMYSLPIPVLSDGKLSIAAFRLSVGYDAENNGLGMDAPDRVLYFDPETGALLRKEPLPPASTLGTEPFDIPPSEYLALRSELYASYDTLLPAFARGEKHPSPEVRAAAVTYTKIFPRFSGKLLVPYYERIGKDWFSWLASIPRG